MKDNWVSMLHVAQQKVEEGAVDVNFLKTLLEQITSERSMLLDDKFRAIIKSLEAKIDDDMTKKISKCKTGKELVLHFYEELQKGFPEEQEDLLADIFSEVTEWVKQ